MIPSSLVIVPAATSASSTASKSAGGRGPSTSLGTGADVALGRGPSTSLGTGVTPGAARPVRLQARATRARADEANRRGEYDINGLLWLPFVYAKAGALRAAGSACLFDFPTVAAGQTLNGERRKIHLWGRWGWGLQPPPLTPPGP